MWNHNLLFICFLTLLTISSSFKKVSFTACDGYDCHENKSSTILPPHQSNKSETTTDANVQSPNKTNLENNTILDYPEYTTLSDDLEAGNSSENEIEFDLSSLVSDVDCQDFPKKSEKCCLKHPDLKWCQRRSLEDGTNEYEYDKNNIYGIFKPTIDRRPFVKHFPNTYTVSDSHFPINVPKSYRPPAYPINAASDYLPPINVYSTQYYTPQYIPNYPVSQTNPPTIYVKTPSDYNPNISPNIKTPSDYNLNTSPNYNTNPSGLTRQGCLTAKTTDPYCCQDFPDLYWCGNSNRVPMIEDPCVCVPKDQCQFDVSMYARELRTVTFCSDPKLVCCPKSRNSYGPPSIENCGKISPSIANSRSVADYARILDRDYAVFGEVPWMGALLQQVNHNYVCGAVLIDKNWALTAAHCVKNFTFTNYVLRVGKRNLNDDLEPAHQEPRVSKVIIHPEFNTQSLINDIALLKLEPSVVINDYINIVCLPPDMEYNLFDCQVSGWGKDSLNGSFSEILKKMKVPLIQRQTCENMYKNSPLGVNFNLHSNFLCAGERLKDACKGDGGSPLVCKVGDIYRLVGIVSWGIGCGNDYPGVYTKVTSFVPWILNIITYL